MSSHPAWMSFPLTDAVLLSSEILMKSSYLQMRELKNVGVRFYLSLTCPRPLLPSLDCSFGVELFEPVIVSKAAENPKPVSIL